MILPRYLINGGAATLSQILSREREREMGNEWDTFYERCDAFLMFKRLRLFDQVDLILENDDVLEFHYLYGGQML